MSAVSATSDSSDLATLARGIVEHAQRAGASARLLGGVGVAAVCPSARPGGPLERSYGDIDVAVRREDCPPLAQALRHAGYEPDERFNALQGRRRMLFTSAAGVHADVFVNTFVMCHELPLRDRLHLGQTALAPADLLLTKLQIAELNLKDVTDVAALVLDHALGDTDEGINVPRIAGLAATDWGWWRSLTENLARVPAHLGKLSLTPWARERVMLSLTELRRAVNEAPKSLKWRARARIGDRLPWRDEPEEQ